MTRSVVDEVVAAVLYEGYLLYPYRPSSVKNRHRWTFGGIVPRAYSEAQGGSEAWIMRTECLVHGDLRTALRVRVRFLHVLERTCLHEGEAAVPVAWQEAVEREILADEASVAELVQRPRRTDFAFPDRVQREPLRSAGGQILGESVRSQQAVCGEMELAAERLADDLFRVAVQIRNLTAMADADRKIRDEAMLQSFVSTHTILGVEGGAFVSLLEPPDVWQGHAAACRNVGAWPVLVGESGQRDTLLASPIILYDYPQVAPESPGDLFDATEIDEILTLRILTLTEEEKREIAAADPKARALLERTEALAPAQRLQLHGSNRSLQRLPGRDAHA